VKRVYQLNLYISHNKYFGAAIYLLKITKRTFVGGENINSPDMIFPTTYAVHTNILLYLRNERQSLIFVKLFNYILLLSNTHYCTS